MNEEVCLNCNGKLIRTLTPKTIHYGRLDCLKCGFVGWARDPQSSRNNTTQKLRIGKRSLRQVADFHNFDITDDESKIFCFFCLKMKHQLGYGEVLTVDHIMELNKGGKDEVENTQIFCSACHKLKNWARLYTNWHLKKEGAEGDARDF